MKNLKSYSMLVFSLNEYRFALPYFDVSRVIRAMEIASLPRPKTGVLGLINIHACIIPVIDIRYFLEIPNKNMTIHDYIIIIDLKHQHVAFVVQTVNFMTFPESALYKNDEFNLSSLCIKNMIKDIHGIIPILDMQSLVGLADIQQIHEDQQIKQPSGEAK